MAKPVIGMGAYLALAEETAWGTAVTPATHFARIISSGIQENRNRELIPHLANADASTHTNPADFAEYSIEVGGDVVAPLYYNNFACMAMLKHALGAVATTGAGPYDHEFTFDIDGTNGLTLQQIEGQHGSLNTVRVVEGCVINTMGLQFTPGQVAQATFGILAEAIGAPTTLSGSASFPTTDVPVLPHQATISWNGSTWIVTDLSVNFDKKLTRRPRVGSQYTQEPWVSDFAEITIDATRERLDNDLITAYRATTQSDMTITLTGSGNNALVIELHNAYIRTHDSTVSGPGSVTETVQWRALAGTTASETGIEITVTNDNSGALS